jgi:general L-amino acid transport system substrate-binding protein
MTATAILISAAGVASTVAGTLESVRTAGALRCGIGEDRPGFSRRDATGDWVGLDADFCRAVAAAVLGDASKVRFVPLLVTERFAALKAGRVHLLARSTSWTLSREAGFEVLFVGPLIFDAQKVLVRADGGIRGLADLGGRSVCVLRGTDQANKLTTATVPLGVAPSIVVTDGESDLRRAFAEGRCEAASGDETFLSALRLQPDGPPGTALLDDVVGKEVIGPWVRQEDGKWFGIVRAVLSGLVAGEEHRLGRDAARAALSDPSKLSATYRDAMLRVSAGYVLADDWLLQALAAVGHHGEILDRHFGEHGTVPIPRGRNTLWRDGGLFFAPPF